MQEEYKGYTIKIDYNEYPENPREWDNLGKMICFHRQYDLGDKHDLNSEDYNDWNEVLNVISNAESLLPNLLDGTDFTSIEDKILDLIDNRDDFTRSDLQGVVQALVLNILAKGSEVNND